jgi:hypothetical protein
LALVAEQPDLTLEETIAELLKRQILTSKSAVSRFFQRHDITFEERVCERPNGTAPTWPGAPTLDPRARYA